MQQYDGQEINCNIKYYFNQICIRMEKLFVKLAPSHCLIELGISSSSVLLLYQNDHNNVNTFFRYHLKISKFRVDARVGVSLL